MKYYIEQNKDIFEADIISSDAFINCGNDTRKELNEKYRELEPLEMYQLIENADTWDAYDPEFYADLYSQLGLDEDAEWEDVEKAIAEM